MLQQRFFYFSCFSPTKTIRMLLTMHAFTPHLLTPQNYVVWKSLSGLFFSGTDWLNLSSQENAEYYASNPANFPRGGIKILLINSRKSKREKDNGKELKRTNTHCGPADANNQDRFPLPAINAKNELRLTFRNPDWKNETITYYKVCYQSFAPMNEKEIRSRGHKLRC